METIKKLGGWLMGVTSTVLVIAHTMYYTHLLSDTYLFDVRIGGLAIFALGFLLYVGQFTITSIMDLWGRSDYIFHMHRMKPSEMDVSIALSRELFPSIPTKRELKNIYKANNSVCRLQHRYTKVLGHDFIKYTGVCSVLPMTDEAMALLEKEELHGLKFTPEHITKPGEEHSCLYIGSVGALGLRAKRHIITYLEGLVGSEFEKGVKAIYTRPTTKDGLRVAKRFGFSPVLDDADENELGRLYKLSYEDYMS